MDGLWRQRNTPPIVSTVYVMSVFLCLVTHALLPCSVVTRVETWRGHVTMHVSKDRQAENGLQSRSSENGKTAVWHYELKLQ